MFMRCRCRLMFLKAAFGVLVGGATAALAQPEPVQPRPNPPTQPPATELRGAAALQNLLDRLRYMPVVRLRGPAAEPGTSAGLTMTIHIGENRVYPFSNLAGKRVLELGTLEPGWTTFRLADIATYAVTRHAAPVPLQTGLSCSGGFEVRADQELEIVLVHDARGVTCTLR
jgi:hypothetical protein